MFANIIKDYKKAQGSVKFKISYVIMKLSERICLHIGRGGDS